MEKIMAKRMREPWKKRESEGLFRDGGTEGRIRAK